MAKFAERTQVPTARTKAEIEQVLDKYGADSFMFGSHDGHALVAFKMHGRVIRFMVPMPRMKDCKSPGDLAQKNRQKYRALLLSIKAKLESVESGIETFETAFMSHLVLPGGKTVGDQVLPAIANAYKSGQPVALLPGW